MRTVVTVVAHVWWPGGHKSARIHIVPITNSSIMVNSYKLYYTLEKVWLILFLFYCT